MLCILACMKKVTIIAAVANNNVIGKNGKIPWDIPEEMELFKQHTMGHALIVGRKTYESIGHALPDREMFVLSHSPLLLRPATLFERSGDKEGLGGEITFCTSIQDALDKTKKERTVFVMGGGDVYAQMMPLVDEMRISHLKEAYEGDCFFPDIDRNTWRISEQQEFPDFIHTTYTRI